MTEHSPVSTYENEKVKGNALSGDRVWQMDLAEIEELRGRQRAYIASLPTEPADRIAAIRKIMHPDSEAYPAGFEEAQALGLALQAMIQIGDVDENNPEVRRAALWIADRMETLMRGLERDLQRIADLCRPPDSFT